MTSGMSVWSTVPCCRKMAAAFDVAKRSPKLGQPALLRASKMGKTADLVEQAVHETRTFISRRSELVKSSGRQPHNWPTPRPRVGRRWTSHGFRLV
jgi:hypothetical protein